MQAKTGREIERKIRGADSGKTRKQAASVLSISAFAVLIALWGASPAEAQRVGEPPEPGRVYTGEGRWIGGLPDLAARLEGFRFVAVGETHDNPDHHRIQAALAASFKPETLAFEMFPATSDEILNDLRSFGVSRERLAAALDWENLGWGDWGFYAQILEAAPWARIAGGALPSEVLRRTSAEGLSAAPEDLVARYALTEPMAPEDRAELLEIMTESHCGHLPPSRVEGMTAVQRLWDASFAEAWARGTGEEGRGLLIAGAAHVRSDWAAPALMRRAHPEAAVAAVGLFGHRPEAQTLADYHLAPYDFIVISEADPERPDPCAGLRAAAEKRAAAHQETAPEEAPSEAAEQEEAPAE